MDGRSPERWEKVKKWAREKTTIAFWLVLLALFVLLMLLWVAFGSHNNCSCHYVCWLLGVTEKAAALKTLGFIIAGIVAFWGVMAANRRSDAMAESAKASADTAKANADTAKANADTAKTAEAGNRQQAFKDGLERLGSEKASMRLIGSRALFYVAMEDEKQRAAIASFLCAYIRETTGDKGYQGENKDKPSTEMQSLLKLLFTTETVDQGGLARFWQDVTPDLEGGYFRGAELRNAQFQGAKLNSVQFQRASLGEAQFQEASLDGAQFERASLKRAQFQGARFRRARFQGVDLWGAQFEGALLREAQFQGARLGTAQFQGAWLDGAQFQGAWLTRAQCQGASLDGAQFQGASLHGVEFQGASLEGAQFQGALLGEARFQGARLKEAQFQGASLGEARFQGASLYMAGFQQAKFGQGSGHDGIPAQDHAAANSDGLAEQFKASAFHGVSSEPLVITSFEERINERAGKESDFSGVTFSGGVTREKLAEVKEAFEKVPRLFDDFDFKEKLIRDLASEIGQDKSHTPLEDVLAGSYSKEDAERWIREFREAMATVPETNQPG